VRSHRFIKFKIVYKDIVALITKFDLSFSCKFLGNVFVLFLKLVKICVDQLYLLS
jgi:hypothetical protein